MPVYGDLSRIKAMLEMTDASQDDLLSFLQEAFSRAFEQQVGKTFGAPEADTTVVVGGPVFGVVLLPRPARAITSVMVGGSWNGAAVTGGTLLAVDEYVPTLEKQDGTFLGVYVGGTAATLIVVTGDFADTDDDTDVPVDVEHAVEDATRRQYKVIQAAPSGFVGPDGFVQPVTKAMDTEIWKAAVKAHGIRRSRVSV